MSTTLEFLKSVGTFVAGILSRVGIALVLLAAVALPSTLLALFLRFLGRRAERKLGLHLVGGVRYRPGLAYAPGHTWVESRSPRMVELGIDDIAQRLLSSVTAVQVPRAGTKLERGDVIATLSGGGHEIKLRTPLPGTVVGVNASVIRDPGLVKRDLYGKGWLVAVAPSDSSLKALPTGEAAEGWMRKEAGRWSRFLEDQLGFAVADGGELLAPAPWLMGEEGFRRLSAAFLTV